MKKLWLVLFLFILPCNALADNPPKLAIIPSVNNVALQDIIYNEEAPYYYAVLPQLVNEQINTVFSSGKYSLQPLNSIEKVLNNYGYDLKSLELPEKDDMNAIAKSSGVEALVVLEIFSINIVKVDSMRYKYTIITRYKACNTKNGKYLSRKFLYVGPLFRFKALPSSDGYKELLTEPISGIVNQISAELKAEKIMN